MARVTDAARRGDHVARGVLDGGDRLGGEGGAPVEAVGWVVRTSLVAAPATVNVELVAAVSPVAAAESLNGPWVPSVIVHPPNDATPAVAESGFAVHARVPVPVEIEA